MSKRFKKYVPSDYFEYRELKARQIMSGQKYQRLIKSRKIKARADNYDPYKVHIVDVSYRDGKYYCSDGQHTIALLVYLFGEDVLIPCRIFKNTTYEQDALLYASQDNDRTPQSKLEILNAMYEGKKPDAVKFKNIVVSYGYECDFTKPTNPSQRRIGSADWLFKTMQNKGEKRLNDLLSIVTEAWGAYSKATKLDILRGLDRFLDRIVNIQYNSERYDRKRLVHSLSLIDDPQEIVKKAKRIEDKNGSDKCCTVIVNAYNYRLSEDKKLLC